MIFSYLLNMQSHPSWVCGLKLQVSPSLLHGIASHPSWVCGLKLLLPVGMQQDVRHTLRGCVD